jgi:hypothetical protein
MFYTTLPDAALNLPPKEAAPTEWVMPGLEMHYLFCGTAIAFRATRTSPETLNAWTQRILEACAALPYTYPLFILNDFTAPTCYAMPSALQRGGELQRLYPRKPIFSASVTRPETTLAMLVDLTQVVQTRLCDSFQGGSFETYPQAVDWLYEQVQRYYNSTHQRPAPRPA